MSRPLSLPSFRPMLGGLVGITLLAAGASLAAAQDKTTPVQECLASLMKLRASEIPAAQAAAQAQNRAGSVAAFDSLKVAAKACATKSSAASLSGKDLGAYGTTQILAGDYPGGIASLERYGRDTSITALERGGTIESAQQLAISGTMAPADVAKQFVTLADSTHIVRPRLNTRIMLAQVSRMNPATAGDSYALIRDVITIAKEDPDTATLAKRAKPLGQLVKMAGAWAQQDGRQYDAQVVSDQAEAVFGKYHAFKIQLHPDAMIGSPAEALLAPKWLNAPSTMSKQSFGDGKVYLVEFTAHWCGPCRMSYPALAALYGKYKDKGFNVVMSTRLFGYFGEVQDLKPDVELDSLKHYFAEHQITYPVAVSGAFAGLTGDAANDVNGVNYNATGLPTIVLIDGKGIVRGYWQGWSEEMQAAVESVIEQSIPGGAPAAPAPKQGR